MGERLSVLAELPDEVHVLEGRGGVLAVRGDLEPTFLAAGFGPDAEPRLESSDLVGKRPLEEFRAGGERFVVRRFHHGGLLRWITRSRFRDAQRPFRELVLQRELERRGIPSPEVVAARARRAAGGGWRLAVVTRRIEGGVDLGRLAAARARGELALADWRAAVRAAGRFVARMHAAGFVHADLTPRNLLVESPMPSVGEPRMWALDLDRSHFEERLSDLTRRDNLRRLLRHVERVVRERGLAVSATDRARFLGAYQPERSARRADARAIAELHARRSRVHSAGWVLEGRLGRGRSGAEAHLDAGPDQRPTIPPG